MAILTGLHSRKGASITTNTLLSFRLLQAIYAPVFRVIPVWTVAQRLGQCSPGAWLDYHQMHHRT